MKTFLSIIVIVAVVTESEVAETATDTKLLQLAKERFTNNLSITEEKLFQAVANDEVCYFTTGSEREDNPTNSPNWTKDRVIRADRLAWLCTDPASSALVTYRGVGIGGLRIDGVLNLDFANITFPLKMQKCFFTDSMVLFHCRLRGLDLGGTYIKDLQADEAKVEGDIYLCDGCAPGGRAPQSN
jgi:hypothetical protein